MKNLQNFHTIWTVHILMLAMIPTYTNSVSPPFPNDHSTYSWGWVESQGGGNIFINSSWSCQLGVKVISHQSVKSFCCILVLKIIFTLPQFTLKVKSKVYTRQAVNSVVYHNFSAICFVAILPPSINWVLVEQMISLQLYCYTT